MFGAFRFLVEGFRDLHLVLEVGAVSGNDAFTSKLGILPFANLHILAFQFLVVLEKVPSDAQEHLVNVTYVLDGPGVTPT